MSNLLNTNNINKYSISKEHIATYILNIIEIYKQFEVNEKNKK